MKGGLEWMETEDFPCRLALLACWWWFSVMGRAKHTQMHTVLIYQRWVTINWRDGNHASRSDSKVHVSTDKVCFQQQHNLAESITKYDLVTSMYPFFCGSGGCIWRLVPFDGAIDGKVLKKVPEPLRNLITSIHYLHSEQSRGSPSVIRFICIVNTCPACLCLHIFYKLPFMAGKMLTFPSKYINSTSSKNILNVNNLVYV